MPETLRVRSAGSATSDGSPFETWLANAPVEPLTVARAAERTSPPTTRGREAALATERGGAPFVWPDLDAPCYADPAAAVERLALKGWSQGRMTPDAPANHTSAAGRYLAADVTYLRTLMGQRDPLDAIVAYDRALRLAPDFPDASRALLMIGFASLRMDLAPEADTTFGRVLAAEPHGRYASLARLGRAKALRARRRYDEARSLLAEIGDGGTASVRCGVLAERAGLARATTDHAVAVRWDEGLARECPRSHELAATIVERADSLLAVGRRADARALLEHPGNGADAEVTALVLMRGADLAREDGDLDAARAALDHVLGLRIGRPTRSRVRARLARLDGVLGPDRAVASLETLAATAPSAAAHADVVGVITAALADAGRFEQALARLDAPDVRAAAADPVVAAARDAVLARWLARLADEGDAAGVVTVYGRHRTSIDTRASTATARVVARALAQMGLAAPALRVLRLRDQGGEPVHSLAIADAALAVGDLEMARTMLARLDGITPSSVLDAPRAALAARLTAAEGHPDRVRVDPDAPPDVAVAGALASAWTARGDAALAREAWDVAAEAYTRATMLAPADAPLALAATAGLVAARAGRGAGPDAETDRLATIDDPVVRRAVALLAMTRAFGEGPAPGDGAHP